MTVHNLLELRFRLRAEELRALAGEMSLEENRAILVRTAEDYERLAKSAKLIEVSKARLVSLEASTGASQLSSRQVDEAAPEPASLMADQAQIYRDMAADAKALASAAEPYSRKGWLSLAKLWTDLADTFEQSSNFASRSDE